MFSRKPTRLILMTLLTAALLLTSCNVGTVASPTPDVNALNTAIVGTTVAQLSAQFTQTAQAAPTNTSAPSPTVTTIATFSLPTIDTSGAASPTVNAAALPTFSFVNTPVTGGTPGTGFTQVPALPTSAATASLGDACDNNVFEGDVTIPDGSVLEPGQDFVKIWAVRNTGTCTWDDGYALIYIGGSTPNLDPINLQFTQGADFIAPGETADLDIRLTTPCVPGDYEGHWRMRNDRGSYFGTTLSVYVKVTDDC